MKRKKIIYITTILAILLGFVVYSEYVKYKDNATTKTTTPTEEVATNTEEKEEVNVNDETENLSKPDDYKQDDLDQDDLDQEEQEEQEEYEQSYSTSSNNDRYSKEELSDLPPALLQFVDFAKEKGEDYVLYENSEKYIEDNVESFLYYDKAQETDIELENIPITQLPYDENYEPKFVRVYGHVIKEDFYSTYHDKYGISHVAIIDMQNPDQPSLCFVTFLGNSRNYMYKLGNVDYIDTYLLPVGITVGESETGNDNESTVIYRFVGGEGINGVIWEMTH